MIHTFLIGDRVRQFQSCANTFGRPTPKPLCPHQSNTTTSQVQSHLRRRNNKKMAWLEPLNRAVRLYNGGNDKECIAQIDEILRTLLPPYASIRYHILNAYALNDWYEAEVSGLSLTLTSHVPDLVIITRSLVDVRAKSELSQCTVL